MWFCDPKSRINDKLEQKTSKKIFFLVGYIFPPKAYGGGNLIHRKLYEYLKAKGMDVIPISIGDILALLDKGWRRNFFSLPFFGTVLANPWFCWQLRHCKGLIFADHYFNRHLLLFKFIQRYFLKSRIILSFFHSDYYHSDTPNSLRKSILKLQEHIGYNLAHSIFTISQHAKNEIVSLGVFTNRINVITPGIDTTEFIHFPKEKSDKINLLFVGHLRPRKGLDYLIHACSQLRNQNYVINIIARKESLLYFEKLQNLVKKFKLNGHIVFHDGLPLDADGRKRLSYFYSQADIFVFPSLWEGFGIVLLEAMYYRLPIVASNISAIPELVRDGENGLLVPPADSEALATAVSRLIENPSLRKELGERGYQRVINSYSWENTGEKFYQIVKELSR